MNRIKENKKLIIVFLLICIFALWQNTSYALRASWSIFGKSGWYCAQEGGHFRGASEGTPTCTWNRATTTTYTADPSKKGENRI